MIYTDRSRTIEHQRCPRARYWQYEYRGRGVAPIRLSIPLAVGTYVHAGLGVLLTQARDMRPIDVEAAVSEAVAGYDSLIQNRGLNVEASAEMAFTYREQRALIEAMIRAWAIKQLPGFLEEFEVLEVEHEDTFILSGNVRYMGTTLESLSWMSRADGLLRRIADDDLYVLSFKTAADWDARKQAENYHDMQGLSETYAIEQRIGRKVMGVRMEFLLKGSRDFNKHSGRYEQYSPLVRAWRQQGVTQAEDRYAWRYQWESEGDNGLPVTHRLGRGWTPFYAWELQGGVKGWIDLLASGSIQSEAGDALSAQFISPIPYFRHEDDIKHWLRQARAQESHVAEASLKILSARNEDDRTEMLDAEFPQYTRSCDWPTRCPYQDLCFGGASQDPVGSELYVWRQPHHEPELVQIEGAKEERKVA